MVKSEGIGEYTFYESLYIIYTVLLFIPIFVSFLLKIKKDGWKNVWLFEWENGGSVSLWMYFMAFLCEITHVIRCLDVGNEGRNYNGHPLFGEKMKYYSVITSIEVAFVTSLITAHVLGTFKIISVMGRSNDSSHIPTHNNNNGRNNNSNNNNNNNNSNNNDNWDQKKMVIVHAISQCVCLFYIVIGSLSYILANYKSKDEDLPPSPLSIIATLYLIIVTLVLLSFVVYGANEANKRASQLTRELKAMNANGSIEVVQTRAANKLRRARNILVSVGVFAFVILCFFFDNLYTMVIEKKKTSEYYSPSYAVMEFFCLTVLLGTVLIYRTNWYIETKSYFVKLFHYIISCGNVNDCVDWSSSSSSISMAGAKSNNSKNNMGAKKSKITMTGRSDDVKYFRNHDHPTNNDNDNNDIL